MTPGQGKFHLAGAVTRANRLPLVHAGERPTTTSKLDGHRPYTSTPFVTMTNAQGVTHGDARTAAVCHNGGNRRLGWNAKNWVAGISLTVRLRFRAARLHRHGHSSSAQISRHLAVANSLQRVAVGSLPGRTGDCFGCHRRLCVKLRELRPIPGGDWKGAVGYPGSRSSARPASSSRDGDDAAAVRREHLVTSMSSIRATLNNSMLHTSSQVPASLVPANSHRLGEVLAVHAGSLPPERARGRRRGFRMASSHSC